MAAATPSLFRRLFIAIASLRRSLKGPDFAPPVMTAPPSPASTDAALILLGLLQKEGRLLDFLRDDIQGYSDQEVGAAARVVHQGCRRILDDHLTLTPVRAEAEGQPVTLERGFDAAAIRLTGNLVGEPPFRGTLVHRGWRATGLRLPQVAASHDPAILAPAEVEL